MKYEQRKPADITTAANGEAAACDAWFKAQVHQAIDDPRPGIPADAAREHFAARRDALRWPSVE
ncbi:MAG: hypothetical protein M0Z99_06875 [Betaproteobacteria bacterium]|nr:hypothetical protein [Betaproteobacteria bacterium]